MIKTLSESPESFTLGGYLIVFGSPAHTDLHHEYFHPTTDFALEWFPDSRRPVLYHHGLDPNAGTQPVGVITQLKTDAVGVWCEAQLDKHHRYAQSIRQLVGSGALGWSSGSVAHLVRKETDGRITQWPLIEASLTPTPAQPYFTTVRALKSAFDALHLPLPSVSLSEEFPPMIPPSTSTAPPPPTDSLSTLTQTVTSLTEAVKALQSQLSPVKRLPVASEPPRIEITRATKYSHLTAADMSLMYELLSHGTRGWRPESAFLRELSDKTLKAVQSGALPGEAAHAIKANELDYTGQSGYGADWAAEGWRSELWQKVRQENALAGLFTMIDMPNNPYELPLESGDPTVYYVPESADQAQLTYTSGNPIPQSKVGTGKLTLSAKKLALRVAWSSELNEDSILPIIGVYRGQAIRAMQTAIDNVILNGDSDATANTNINLIDGTPAANSKYLAFGGLRKYSLVTNPAQKKDAAGSLPTLALLRSTRFKLASAYALRPRECAWIVDDQTYANLLNLPEFATMDKAGALATNLTGQVGVIDGIPVFATAELPLARASDGKISATAANNVTGSAILVYRPNWLIGYRRQVQAQVDYLGFADAYHLTVTTRLTLAAYDTKSAVQLFNVGV